MIFILLKLTWHNILKSLQTSHVCRRHNSAFSKQTGKSVAINSRNKNNTVMKKLQSSIAYNALFESHLWYEIVAWGGIRAGNLQRICWFKKRAPCSMTILINLEYNENCRKTFYVLNVMAVIYCTLFYAWEVLCCVFTEKIYKEAQTQMYTAILPYTRH